MSRTPYFIAEDRRRRWTIMALGGGMFLSTLPITDERALFSPFGDVPILGNLSPVAYAVTFGTPITKTGPFGGVPQPSPSLSVPPVAFAARFPAAPAGAAPSLPTGAGNPSFAPNTETTGPAIFSPGDGVPLDTIGPGPGPGDSGNPPPGGTGGGGDTPNPTPAVPEPATWLTLLCGFGVIGGAMRRARARDTARRCAESRNVSEC